MRSWTSRPTGLSTSAVTIAVSRPKQRLRPRATLYSPPPSQTWKVRVVCDAALAGVEPQHHLAEGDEVEAAGSTGPGRERTHTARRYCGSPPVSIGPVDACENRGMRSPASPRTLSLAAAGLTALAVSGCTRTPPPRPVARHLVLVTIDTLRADRLGCYGSRDVATPNLDRLAREGAMAPDATVHVPLTRPSHVSLFTGLLPGRARHPRQRLARRSRRTSRPSPRCSRPPGFRTGGFVSSIVLSRAVRAAAAASTSTPTASTAGDDDARFLNTIQRRGDVAHGGGDRLAREPARPGRFFAWLHLYDPARSLRAARALRVALRGPALRRRGGVVGRAGRPARRRAGAARPSRRHAARGHVRSRRGPRRARRERPRLLRLRDDAARAAAGARPGRRRRARGSASGAAAWTCSRRCSTCSACRPAPAGQLAGRSLARPRCAGRDALARSAAVRRVAARRCCTTAGATCARCATGDGSTSRPRAPSCTTSQEDPGELRNLAAAEPARAEALRTALARAARRASASAAAPTASRRPAGSAREAGRARLPRGRRAAVRARHRRRPQGQDRGVQGPEPPGARGPRRACARRTTRAASRASASCSRAASRASRSTTTSARALAAPRPAARSGPALRGARSRACPASRRAVPGAGRLPDRARRSRGRARRRCARDRREPAATRGLLEREAQVCAAPEAAPRGTVAAYEAAVALAPEGRARCASSSAEALSRHGRPADARCAAARGGRPRSRPRVVLELARHGSGRPERDGRGGEGVPRGALPGCPRAPQYVYNLGLALLRQGRPGRSGRVLPAGRRSRAGLSRAPRAAGRAGASLET